MALFCNSGVNHAEDGKVGGIACVAHTSAPPRNAADHLEIAESCPFLDRKLISAFNETVDGHWLNLQ